MPAEDGAPARVRWAVALLDSRPAEHLLEIGCGTGHAVALVAAHERVLDASRGLCLVLGRGAAIV